MSGQGKKQSVIFQKLDELKELNETFENVNNRLNEKIEWILSKDPAETGSKKEKQEIGNCKLSTDLIEICNNYDRHIKALQFMIEQICL